MTIDTTNQLEEGDELNLQFKKRGGLLPVIVQEYDSGQILMMGYANQEAFECTLKKGKQPFGQPLEINCGLKEKLPGITLK